MMNQFRFTISGCNLVCLLQGKWRIVLKGKKGKCNAERQLCRAFPSQAQMRSVQADSLELSIYCDSAVVAHCLNMLLTNQL